MKTIYIKSNHSFIIVLALQLSLIGLILSDYQGINIPFARSIIGFLFLTFSPGILLIRILRIERLNNIEYLLIAVGLSISIWMFGGALINIILSKFNTSPPLSFINIFLFVICTTTVLLILSLFYGNDFKFVFRDLSPLPPLLILSLLPILTIIGTYFVNYHKNSSILFSLLCLIAAIFIFVGFDKGFRSHVYAIAIFTIAISLLYHNSLISNYIWGWDIQNEFELYRSIMANSYWDYTSGLLPIGNLNGVLSITILPIIYSSILNVRGEIIFKWIYPFFFSLVPLGFYDIYRKLFDEHVAFFSAVYLISMFPFYVIMPTLARQELAELFFVLIILLKFSKVELPPYQKSTLIICFSMGLIGSHYGLTYIFLLILISYYAFERIFYFIRNDNKNFVNVRFYYLMFFIVFALFMYIYFSNSSIFISFINVFKNIYLTIYAEFAKTEASDLITSETLKYPTEFITRYFYIISQILIFIGLIYLTIRALLKDNAFASKFSTLTKYFPEISNGINIKYLNTYIILSLILISMLIGTALTNVGIDILRIFHICVLLLAPFCVIGGEKLINLITFFRHRDNKELFYRIFSIFIAIFFLLNSAVVSEIIKDYPHSISLSQSSVESLSEPKVKYNYYSIYNVHEQDVFSATWFDINRKDKNITVYADYFSENPLLSYGQIEENTQRRLTEDTRGIPHRSFVYLSYPNVKENLVAQYHNRGNLLYTSEIYSYLLKRLNKIYNNGGSEIYSAT